MPEYGNLRELKIVFRQTAVRHFTHPKIHKMKSFLICIMLFSSSMLLSQDYIPFDFQNGIWITDYYEFGGTDYSFQYYCEGDTLIDHKTYHKLFQYSIETYYVTEKSLTYYGAIANDTANRKVVFIGKGLVSPEILYNFDIEAGDTITEGIGENLVITEVDSIILCGRYHRKYVIQRNQPVGEDKAFIEGIGYSFGFIPPLVMDPFETRSSLICYTERHNEECEECELLLSNQTNYLHESIKVYPNPTSDKLKITHTAQFRGIVQLSVYDELGELVEILYFDSNTYPEIYVGNYSHGLYFIRLSDSESSRAYRCKFIVK